MSEYKPDNPMDAEIERLRKENEILRQYITEAIAALSEITHGNAQYNPHANAANFALHEAFRMIALHNASDRVAEDKPDYAEIKLNRIVQFKNDDSVNWRVVSVDGDKVNLADIDSMVVYGVNEDDLITKEAAHRRKKNEPATASGKRYVVEGHDNAFVIRRDREYLSDKYEWVIDPIFAWHFTSQQWADSVMWAIADVDNKQAAADKLNARVTGERCVECGTLLQQRVDGTLGCQVCDWNAGVQGES